MRSHKVIVAIARRAYCFYFYLYIAPLLLLWDLSTLCLYMTVSLQCLFKDSWQLCQLRLSSSSLVLCLVSWYRGDNWKSKTSQWNTHCKQFFTKFWTSCLRKQGTGVTFHKLCWLFTRMTKIRYPLDISKTCTHENNRFPSTVKSRGVFSTLSNIYNEAFL